MNGRIFAPLLGALTVLCSLSLPAQERPGIFLPVTGGLSGMGAGAPFVLFAEESAQGSPWNPALGADRELPLYTFGGTVTIPTEGGSGAAGALSAAAVHPAAFGTLRFAADGAFPSDSLPAWAAHRGISLAAALSKRATDRLALGIGLGTAYLAEADTPWTARASAGALLDLPSLGPAGGALSLSLLSLGPTSEGGLPGPTPLLALVARIVEGERFGLSLGAMLAAPGFEDLAAGLGASFALGRSVHLDLGWTASARHIESWRGDADPLYAPSPLPSVALRIDGSSVLKLGRYGASTTLGVVPLAEGTLAAEAALALSPGERDRLGPRIEAGPLDREHYSPRMEAELPVPLSIRDESFIARWEAVLVGPSGNTVRRYGSAERAAPTSAAESEPKAPGPAARLFSLRRGVSVPDGIPIPLAGLEDGRYRLRISAEDERGNRSGGAEVAFVVDGTPPAATAAVRGHRRFSPNGDGVRDVLAVDQAGSSEALWTGTFRNAEGRAVRTYSWTDGEPQPFLWDGRGEDGAYLPDGSYSYTLSSIDGAGNPFALEIRDLAIDAAPTGAVLELDGAALSPDPSSQRNSLRLRLTAAAPRSVEQWSISVLNDRGEAVRTWAGRAANLDELPSSLLFDGRTERGDPVPDGLYRFRAELGYLNGDRPVALSGTFVVDSRRPEGKVRASLQVINLDRSRRTVLYHDLSPRASWTGILETEGGARVRTFALEGGESALDWNGMGAEGEPVAEGIYVYYAEGLSAVGLRGRTEALRIRVESGGFDVALLAEGDIFSARAGSGRMRFYPRVARPDRAVSYSLVFRSADTGAEARRVEGRAPLPAAFAWNGRDDFDAPLPDGLYEALLTVRFDGGAAAEAERALVRLDSTPPALTLSLATPLFSPNGDGVLDRAEFRLDAEPGIRWRGELRDERGRSVREFDWQGRPPAVLSWDGTDGSGSPLPDGSYRLRVSGTDGAGNAAAAETPPLRLDARRPSGAIAADKTAFSPNGDGFADAVKLRLIPSFTDGLAAWRLYLRDGAGNTVRVLASAEGSGGRAAAPPPEAVLWDGTLEAGRRAPDGYYSPAAELRYLKGDTLALEGSVFLLDTTPPRVELTASPTPFSPDGDGMGDELFLRIDARDESPVDAWALTILDPAGAPFTSFSGREPPAGPIVWDGRDLDGNLVEAAQDYRYVLRVRDALGNMAEKRGIIPTDVFVLRDGDRLKIRISSIVFSPSSASLAGTDPESAARNAAILDRIAAVLDRYPSYRIRVEGHAVNITGTEREERTELEGLSLARARAVMDALVLRGVARGRLEARGLGGREPLVPHGDAVARWRNRRVEFILVR